ncbi:MAG: DUF973 family protein [Thermoplasmatales archaeon]|nr:DUF973 family protein [Thermoplasmatales archaeon]MCW6170615.1 DUF973 family protein [Thermoplasmatales archaeon]
MTKQCPNCFFENPDSARFCEVCGKPLQPAGVPPLSPGALDARVLSSIRKLRFAFIITLFSSVLSYVLYAFAFILDSHFASLGPSYVSSPNSNPFASLSAYFSYLVPILVLSLLLTIVTYYFIIDSFRGLKKISYDFSIGYNGGIMILISEVAVTLLVLLLLAVLFPLVASPSNVPPSSLPPLLGLIVGILIFAIPLIIGIIFLAVGIYRVGDRFESDSLRAGAIINIFIPLVAAILIIYATTKIIESLNTPGRN